MTITEIRVVYQDWYETDCTKTGWDSHGWHFNDGDITEDWAIINHISVDKFGNPTIGIAEKYTIINK